MPWDHRGIKQFEAQQFVDILTNLKDAPSSQPFVVLDVRDLHEHEIESLSKMMSVEKLKANFPLIKLPLMDLLQDVTEDIPKKKTIVCICTNGLRSGRAMQYLEMKGYTH
jgi:rhodanese-related sulfurtransferase